MNKIEVKKYEQIVLSFLFVICGFGLFLFFTKGGDYFQNNYVPEDGIIENGTALGLFIGAMVMLRKLFLEKANKGWLWIIGTAGFVLLFIFGAGEEISWGQRLFGWETSAEFASINKQDETNLHNIRFGDFDVNKLIFSKLLTVFLILYLLFLPYFYQTWNWLKKTIDIWGVPVPKWHHTIAFLAMTILLVPIDNGKKWELYEFGFATIFILIFLNSANQTKTV